MKYLSATTEFSLGTSLLSVEDITGDDKKPGLVKEYGIDKAFVCDTMNVSAMIPLSDKLGDKLAFGVRFTLVDELLDDKKLPIYQPKVYPLSENAMQILYKYLSKSFEKPNFYFVPRLDFEQFYEMLNEGGNEFAVTTGDFNSLLKHKDFGSINQVIDKKTSYFFIETVNVHNAVFHRVNSIAKGEIVRYGYKYVNLRPSLYLKGDESAFPIHYSINKNVEFNFLNPYNKDFYYKDDNLNDNHNFGKLPFYVWQKQDPKLPAMSAKPDETLKLEVMKGFRERFTRNIYGHKPTNEELEKEYIPRLKYELDVLSKLGFASYFLMVWELTSWCQRQGIYVGPGRGSAAGSLVSYCLKITDVDPIRAGLMFERFINPSRLDLPDIDLDFQKSRRPEIIEHLYDRYGKENVAGIINYATLQSKSALRSTGRILGLPQADIDASKLIPSAFGETASLEKAKAAVVEVKQFSEKYPDAWSIATKLEERMRNYGTHAAGIIVSNRPLINDAVIEQRGDSRVINWDKKICEKQGLVKLDALGLATLDVFDMCQKLIKERHGVNIDLHSIPLDDKRVLDAFSKGKTGGVFQFEGGSVKRLLRDLSSTLDLTFDDLVAANALNRPGPIQAGIVQQYVSGKNGDPVDPWHPSIGHLVSSTFNIPAYQEQIMQIAGELAGYTLPEADNLRKIMGKKDAKAMEKETDKFINGCVANGVSKEVAEDIFNKIKGFAQYAFNKSHSYAYSLVGYLAMYLKVYYPAEFYSASLTYIDDDKVRGIINEAKKEGIQVMPPEINTSTDKFMPKDEFTIVAPLNKIKYLSDAAAQDIMSARKEGGPFKDYDDFVARTTKRFVNARVLKGLDSVGSLDGILGRTEAEIDPEDRSRAINEYLPSIPLGYVSIARKSEIDKGKASQLRVLFDDIKTSKAPVIPHVGNNAKIMVIVDNASGTEVKAGMFTESGAFKSADLALYKAGMDKSNVYWTGVVKRAKEKGEKLFSAETLEESYETLRKEIDIVRPTVVIALGTNAARFFLPTLKGAATDHAGTVLYDKSLDANIILGFSPGVLFFNPDMSEKFEELFELASSMI